MTETPRDLQAQLAREREEGRRTAFMAFAAALFMAAGLYLSQSGFEGAPIGNRSDFVRFIADHGSDLILSSVVTAVGFILLVPVTRYLDLVTRFRKPDLLKAVLIFAIAGPLLYGVSSVARSVLLASAATDYAAQSTQTTAEATDILRGVSTSTATAAVIGLQAGQVALALWLMLGPLYAMRVGLLTRPVGILGIILGGAVLIQAPFAPVLMLFWIAALAALFLGYWPGGRPKAWQSGTAVPWPSARQRAQEAQQPKEIEVGDSTQQET